MLHHLLRSRYQEFLSSVVSVKEAGAEGDEHKGSHANSKSRRRRASRRAVGRTKDSERTAANSQQRHGSQLGSLFLCEDDWRHSCRERAIRSHRREGGAPAPSQAFLLEMMERRDAAEALTEDGQREALLDEVEGERAQTFAAAVKHLESGAFEDAARALLVLRYLDRFVESLEEALDKAG